MNERPLVIGHRGAMGVVKENTLASMEAAIASGCDMIELDVHVIEGELIVFHDHRLERLTGRPGRLADVPLARLHEYTVDGHAIPTMRQVAQLCKGRVGLNIEIKGQGCVEALAQLYGQMLAEGWAVKDVLVSSFDHIQLAQLKARFPLMHQGILMEGQPVDLAAPAEALGGNALHVSQDFITPEYLADAKARNLKVYVYTANYEEDMARLVDMGVDGIITDFPDLLHKVIAERFPQPTMSVLVNEVVNQALLRAEA